jgi:hypothetical protein
MRMTSNLHMSIHPHRQYVRMTSNLRMSVVPAHPCHDPGLRAVV